ncbi:MAG: hypothetical protein H7245_17185 [Candidatus Saccharibacteria bacterium]|nr:hypothetical protein [Pseudorhodobacter sp.]
MKKRSLPHLARGFELKICIIGSSHIASLKLGWEMVRDQFADDELVFFGGPRKSWRNSRAINGKLVSIDPKLTENIRLTSGGLHEIDPNQYDAFLLYGLVLRVPRLRRGISKAVMQETVKDVVEMGLTKKVAKRLRSITNTTVWIGANPMKLALDGETEPGTFYTYDRVVAELQKNFVDLNARFLLQPSETMASDLRTPRQFGEGAVRMRQMRGGANESESAQYSDDDEKHTNGEFGRLWLLQNLPLIVPGAVR